MWKSYRSQSRHEEFSQPIIAIPLTLLALPWCCDTLDVLTAIITYIISIFPSLTGLALAGYTIIAGGLNSSILQRLCRSRNGHQSMHQTLTTSFAVAMVIMLSTLSVAYVLGVLCAMGYTSSCPDIVNSVNILLILAVVYLSCAAFRSLYSIVINVFNFGQYINLIESNCQPKSEGKKMHELKIHILPHPNKHDK